MLQYTVLKYSSSCHSYVRASTCLSASLTKASGQIPGPKSVAITLRSEPYSLSSTVADTRGRSRSCMRNMLSSPLQNNFLFLELDWLNEPLGTIVRISPYKLDVNGPESMRPLFDVGHNLWPWQLLRRAFRRTFDKTNDETLLGHSEALLRQRSSSQLWGMSCIVWAWCSWDVFLQFIG